MNKKKTNMTDFWFFFDWFSCLKTRWTILCKSCFSWDYFICPSLSTQQVLSCESCNGSNFFQAFYSFISNVHARTFLTLCDVWFLQGVLWPVEVAVSLAKGQTDKLKFLCSLISGILNPCVFLHAFYYTLRPQITELIELEQSWWNHLPVQVIHESYIVNIKTETPQNDIHLAKQPRKLCFWCNTRVNSNIFRLGFSSSCGSSFSVGGGFGISQSGS